MARPLRMNLEGGWYHVMHRGIERRAIFTCDRDREHFLELLEEVRHRYRFVIHAYAQMTNHYHAIVETPDGNLSQGMQWLHLSYSAWFNARYDRAGALFQGRFKSVPVEAGAWANELIVYLHLNPLNIAELSLDKAGKKAEGLGWVKPTVEQVKERLKWLREYRWSSYRAYGGYEKTPEWLETGALLGQTGKEGIAQQRQAYRQVVKHRLSHGIDEGRLERLRDGLAIGSETFRRRVVGAVGTVSRETSGRRALRRRVRYEEVVHAVEQVKGEEFDAFVRQRGDWGRPTVMWLARRHAGMTLRDIGQALGGVDYSAVHMAIKYWQKRCETTPALRRKLAECEEQLSLET